MSAASTTGIDKKHRKVILASSLGTVFEWYDFYLYGSLVGVIGKHFYTGLNETTSLIMALLTFAAGFAVRPLGALVFGRLGDLIGRKHTFLLTIVIMGASTGLVGILPTYASIGVAAPIILVALRLLQGLAIGGEYGGAATYVAEHAPPGRRGYYTSWIQTTATVGMVLSLLIIVTCRWIFGEAFDVWAWRIPFLLSVLLLAVSVYIRMQLEESPVFHEMRSEGKLSKAPLSESFLRWSNLKVVLLSLFGAVAGQAVIAYAGLAYMAIYLEQTLKVDPSTTNLMVALSLGAATPFFVVFGKLSDTIGRKKLVVGGCLLGAIVMFPLFKALVYYANPGIAAAQESSPIVVVADPKECSFQFDPSGQVPFSTSCDVAKSNIARAGVPYLNESAAPGTIAIVRVGDRVLTSFDGTALSRTELKTRSAAFGAQFKEAIVSAGYPAKADPNRINFPMLFLIMFLIALLGPVVYGSLAAWLVELFPARIRYTSMSLPYHIGNGWFGGFLPTVSFALIAYTGNIYQGLWYPVIVGVTTFVIGGLFLRETNGVATEE
ncbi:MAG TPA: MFS transporter [Steroidobacteraceae bacterium]|nr:MFS transporter [Steroidobacteraceae bacterium]